MNRRGFISLLAGSAGSAGAALASWRLPKPLIVLPPRLITEAGGSGPYAYQWQWISGGGGIVLTNPLSASTGFVSSGVAAGITRAGLARCIVTDRFGRQHPVDCEVTVTRLAPATVSIDPLCLRTA